MHPEDPLEKRFRLIPAQKSALKRLGILRIRDLLYHFPARYEAGGLETNARALVPGAKVTLFGKLSGLKAKKLWKSKRNITEGWFEDGTGRVKVMWFNQPYMASYVKEGAVVRVSGTVGGNVEKPYIANPEVEQSSLSEISEGMFATSNQPARTTGVDQSGGQPATGNLFPVYPESRGITSRWVYHALQRVFTSGAHAQIEDPIPETTRARLNLPVLADALVWIHTPEKKTHAEAARKRFSFEEMLAIQIARAQERAENDSEPSFSIEHAEHLVEKFLHTSPFPPTHAQRRSIADIVADFSKPHPMARLLEGDVGSGKTLVAAATAYAVVNSRPPTRESGTLQIAYMAPTEILAQQHFESFIQYFRHLPINIALMTGSGCKKFPSKLSPDRATDISRAQLLKWVAGGEIAMLVGTHALIQKSVKFQHLAYAIVDEQHRFGTRQRALLARKGDAVPHFLSMTATPIPRTLALTIYGDLDISVLDELPPGRAKITTTIIAKDQREQCYEKVREELNKGRQAYVICPRINEPDPAKINALQAKSAKAEAARLKKDVFPEFTIGLLHGALKSKEKDEVMKEFSDGKINILVATSVVEVGVNIPNATVILIEGAERFGLAQLHQLRGRVMRSSHPPYCFLLPETRGEVSMKRLKALEKSSDGFKLAEVDLETRGPGDLYGRVQWGISDLGMEALKNPRLIQAARDTAQSLVRKDPTLSNHPALAERVANASKELHGE
ncbi:MAG TPA: ATP-dependent DNA helicase RecG [Candidatus Paceibacterota bacterium]